MWSLYRVLLREARTFYTARGLRTGAESIDIDWMQAFMEKRVRDQRILGNSKTYYRWTEEHKELSEDISATAERLKQDLLKPA